MKKRLMIVLLGGALCVALTVALPVVIAPLLPKPVGESSSGVRLPQSPADYPDPNITWTYRWPGMTLESSIRGIGVYDSWHVSRLRAGWPLPMLEGGEYCEIHSQRGEPVSAALHPVSLKTWWSNDLKKRWQLPTAPVWGGWGLAANWAVWSAGVGLLYLPGAVKRELRRRRRQCLRCGYQLAGANRCAECGDLSSR
ncbi:MAG TPA: hypothetical protein VEB22_05455 [Phycisphaerales bacterium]|nr:hypothetical protein [Phycisphaerales bacterium]